MMKFARTKNKLGFYQVSPLPSEEDLSKHYASTYYQNNHGGYTRKYSNMEKEYFNNRAKITDHIYTGLASSNRGSFLDVGCGEGYFSAYYLSKGWSVEAIDYSSHGLQKHNPEVIEYFFQGDVYSLLQSRLDAQKKYDLINLSNVIEHVRQPLELMELLKPLMHASTILRIQVPNDYSPFQKILVDEHWCTETWFSPPEHLNYFSFASLRNLISDRTFDTMTLMAGFPIETYLMNEHSNYAHDKNKGKAAHFARMQIDNHLLGRDITKYIKYMESAAELEFGRDIIAFIRKARGE